MKGDLAGLGGERGKIAIGRGEGEESGGWGAETGGEESSETKLVTEGE